MLLAGGSGGAYGKSRLISNRKSDGIFDLYFQRLRFSDGGMISIDFCNNVLLIARKAVVLTEYPVSADRHGHIDRQHLSHV